MPDWRSRIVGRPSRPRGLRLEQCHQAVPLLRTLKAVTLLSNLKSLRFRLWDEERQILVGYGVLRTAEGKPRSAAGA